jgi:TRAP-type C4-dicarboxylate transport system permease small subunit
MMSVETMTSILPIALIVIYVLPIAFVIWFMISVIKLAKERNQTLREISSKLNNK